MWLGSGKSAFTGRGSRTQKCGKSENGVSKAYGESEAGNTGHDDPYEFFAHQRGTPDAELDRGPENFIPMVPG